MKYYMTLFQVSTLSETLSQTASDLVEALAGEAGYEAFERTDNGLKGYVQADLYDAALLRQLLNELPIEGATVSFETSEAEDKDWNQTWEEAGFEPIVIGDKCIITGERREEDDITAAVGGVFENDQDKLVVTIDARMAFGTGTHETTRLVVTQLLETDLQDKRVLDCGCGTGILSIIASKRGATEVVAYDIDEWSTENTRHNASLNQVENIEILEGDVKVLSHVSGLFDVVVANINRNILLADMEQIQEVMAAHARFIISGFYASDVPMLQEKADSLGMKMLHATQEGEWCCLVFDGKA